jgi:hypothetical protein
MTVKLRQEADGRILVLTLTGKLEAADYAQFVEQVDQAVKNHGKIRFIVEMHDFHGWTFGALWEDIRFDVSHYSQIERLALIGNQKWQAGMASFCKPFTTATVRYFDEAAADEASIWIHEGIAAASQLAH